MNSHNNKFHTEELTSDQLSFLKRRYNSEYQKFKKARLTALKICSIAVAIFTLLFFVTNKYAPIDEHDTLTHRVSDGAVLIIGCACLIVLSLLIIVAFMIAFFRNFHGIRTDLNEKFKIVERSIIKEKKFMPHNETYHFVIESPSRYSMEVEKEEFYFYEIGDEINLEYTYHSKIDLGYF